MGVIYTLIGYLLILGTAINTLIIRLNESYTKEYRRINKKTICILSFGAIWLLYMSVNPNFSDLHGYTAAIKEVRQCSWSFILSNNIPSLKAEVGYRIFCKLISLITVNPHFFTACTGLIIISGYYKTILKFSPMVIFSILLFVIGPFFQSLYVVRQHMTLSLILLSYPYIIRRDLINFLLLLTLCFLIHQTSIVFLPVYFLYGIKTNRLLWWILGSFGVIAFLVFGFILRYYAEVIAFASAGYGEQYLDVTEEGATSSNAILMFGILSLRIFLLKNEFFKRGINKLLSIILILGFVFSLAGIGFVATSRLFMCYTTVGFIILPNTLSYIRQPNLRLAFASGLFLLYLLPFYSLVSRYSAGQLYFF